MKKSRLLLFTGAFVILVGGFAVRKYVQYHDHGFSTKYNISPREAKLLREWGSGDFVLFGDKKRIMDILENCPKNFETTITPDQDRLLTVTMADIFEFLSDANLEEFLQFQHTRHTVLSTEHLKARAKPYSELHSLSLSDEERLAGVWKRKFRGQRFFTGFKPTASVFRAFRDSNTTRTVIYNLSHNKEMMQSKVVGGVGWPISLYSPRDNPPGDLYAEFQTVIRHAEPDPAYMYGFVLNWSRVANNWDLVGVYYNFGFQRNVSFVF
jgi:hypothetical protein